MNSKQYVLSVLEANRGQVVSGSKLAKELSLSRNAVWKAIKGLKEEGYAIDAVTNKGYSLSSENDILSSQSIEPYLGKCKDSLRIEVHKTITSTNTVMKELAAQGELEGKVIIAQEQTEGRGRLGRSFYSPPAGIYLSILLRPKMAIEDSLFITTTAAVAVAKAIESVSTCDAKIKWVNDIFCNGKKVCGILTEAGIDFESQILDYAVVGIGINVDYPKDGFPEELKEVATSIFEKNLYSTNARSQLVAEVLNNFWGYYEGTSMKSCIQEYRKRSFLIGKEIDVILGNESKKAVALEVDDNARLVVQFTDGEIKTLHSGEVSVRV